MKRLLLFLCFSGLFGFISAQESTDYGIFLGVSQEHRQTIMPIPKAGSALPSFGAYYRYNLNPRHAFRVGANYGMAATTGLASLDIHVLTEFNFLPLNPTLEKPKVSTFVAAGIAFFNVDSFYLKKEAFVLAFNTGVKYRVTERIGLSLEWDLRRKVFGGDPKKPNDLVGIVNIMPSNWYSHFGVTASYNIIKRCKTCPYYESSRKKNR